MSKEEMTASELVKKTRKDFNELKMTLAKEGGGMSGFCPETGA